MTMDADANTATLYDQAARRVDDTPALAPYRDIILADWPEGDAHWQWVSTAPVAEILAWLAPILDAQED